MGAGVRAFRENGQLFVDAAAGDVLEPKMLPAGVQLIAHLRPHRNPPGHSSVRKHRGLHMNFRRSIIPFLIAAGWLAFSGSVFASVQAQSLPARGR